MGNSGSSNADEVLSKKIAEATAKCHQMQPVREKLLTDKVFRSRLLEALALTFSGTKDSEPDLLLNWIMGSKLADREKCMAERNKLAYLFMFFPLSTYSLFPKLGEVMHLVDEKTGALATVNTTNTNLQDDKIYRDPSGSHSIPSAFVTLKYYPNGFNGKSFTESYWWDACAFVQQKMACPSKNAPAWSTIFDTFGRADKLTQLLDSEHKRLCSDVPHIFVGCVSISPESQGKGACSKLMRGINQIADELGYACYLEEGGERRLGIYRRFGYEIASGPHTIDDKEGSYDELHLMMRPAKTPEVN